MAATLPIPQPVASSRVDALKERALPSVAAGGVARLAYRDAARACLPRWLSIMGSAPWLRFGPRTRRAERALASTLYRQQAATLGVAILVEADRDRDDQAYLRERVRTSLVRWQLSLQGDGRPLNRRTRRSALHGATAAQVLLLLTEAPDFRTELLIQDVERHMAWLARSPQRISWSEAALICAMADGAVMVRNGSLLRQARARLGLLLGRQDDEGWFHDRGGADLARLSLTLDALARLRGQTQWDELKQPIENALRLLIHFVHPSGGFGGCLGSSVPRILSPYGVELLAAEYPDAAALARVCREQHTRLMAGPAQCIRDEWCAVLGAKTALAAVRTPSDVSADPSLPHQRTGQTRFRRLAVTIFSTRAYYAIVGGRDGGSLTVTWRNNGRCVSDAGVVAAFSLRTKTATAFNRPARERVTSTAVAITGALRVRQRPVRRLWWWPGNWIRRGANGTSGSANSSTTRRLSRAIGRKSLSHDRFLREITFEEDAIRIRDVVWCRFPCLSLVLQSTDHPTHAWAGGPVAPCMNSAAPIFVNGGRRIDVTRVYRNGELVQQTVKRRAEASSQ